MKALKRMIPVALLIAAICVSVFFSRRQLTIEFNTGMPVQNIEGLRNALDSLIK